MQIVMAILPQAGPVAWFAHIGGLIAGAILVLFLRRPGVPLFDQALECLFAERNVVKRPC